MPISPSTISGRRRLRLLRAAGAVRRAALWLTATPSLAFATVCLVAVLFGGFYALRRGQDVNFDRTTTISKAPTFSSRAGRAWTRRRRASCIPTSTRCPMSRSTRWRGAGRRTGRSSRSARCRGSISRSVSRWPGGWRAAGNPLRRSAIAALAAVFSAAGAMTLSELGSSMSDLLLSPLLLLAVLALVVAAQAAAAGRALALVAVAAALVDLSIGLKLTHSIYVFGLALACVIGWRSWSERLASLVVAGLAGAIGVAVSGGFWFLALWRQFGSPTFPYYDSLFHSPAIDPASALHGRSFFDPRFLPASFFDAIALPIRWMTVGQTTAELEFRDVRFGVVFALIVVAGGMWLWRRRTVRPASEAAGAGRVLVFTFVAFAVWLYQFGIQRYIVGVELLLGPCLLIALRQFLRKAC